MILHGTTLYDYVNAAMRHGLANPSAPQGINDEQSNVLKLVLACAMVAEGSGESDVGHRLFESVRETADQALHSAVIDIRSLPFLVLVVSHKHS